MASKIGILLTSLTFFLINLAGCSGPSARSERSFDQIQALAHGKSAEQILRLLGEPDSREVLFDADERWIWWNYTFLDGRDCPPEMRGRVVHLEIVVRNPIHSMNPRAAQAGRRPYSEWRVDDAFGITYRTPSSGS
ncbi:MAG TPA: hypothetical protein VJ725_27395 [Thermoanaerobaculia bacterium]|nr:hypothetical protein [Thermoanaerobaculia bacterium]